MTIRLWHLWVLLYLASCHVGESHMARLLRVEGNLLATVRKKWKASILQLQGSEFWNNVSELRPKAFPSPAPDDYKTEVLGAPEQEASSALSLLRKFRDHKHKLEWDTKTWDCCHTTSDNKQTTDWKCLENTPKRSRIDLGIWASGILKTSEISKSIHYPRTTYPDLKRIADTKVLTRSEPCTQPRYQVQGRSHRDHPTVFLYLQSHLSPSQTTSVGQPGASQ